MSELREETEANLKYIEAQGYKLEQIWEYQWLHMTTTSLAVSQFLPAIKNNDLFGVVECDIHVPDHLKPKFNEMSPIFKNMEVARDDIGKFMKAFAEEHKIMPRPRRTLIGSYYGEKILLATPLLKWYVEHGLEVTRIYPVVEYTPVPCFKSFGEAVSDASRNGDANEDKTIIADTMKLVSLYIHNFSFVHRCLKGCEIVCKYYLGFSIWKL